MAIIELDCNNCGAPIKLDAIDVKKRHAICDSCGSRVELENELSAEPRSVYIFEREVSKRRVVVLWVVSVLWLSGTSFFSPTQLLRDGRTMYLALTGIYLLVGLVGVGYALVLSKRTTW